MIFLCVWLVLGLKVRKVRGQSVGALGLNSGPTRALLTKLHPMAVAWDVQWCRLPLYLISLQRNSFICEARLGIFGLLIPSLVG